MARFLTRVRLENYKSIAHCDVELQDLTFLVGPNGAGKSNFMDSISIILLIFDAKYSWMMLKDNIENDDRAKSLIRNSENYASCMLCTVKTCIDFSMRRDGELLMNINPPLENTENSSRKISCILYNLDVNSYNIPYEEKNETYLLHDGSNMASILYRIQENDRILYEKINKYIRSIAFEFEKFSVISAGGYYILQFMYRGSSVPFNASQMSDGTLHALGVLTAVFHAKSAGIPLIGIEEPEAGLHPAAARVLYDALAEASQDVQIIVTSHSPDLLDNPDISPDSILAVVRENGETKIGPIDDASRQVLNQHMFTAGELLRLNQLQPKR